MPARNQAPLGAKTAKRAVALAFVSLLGCSQPSANVLAVWVEQGAAEESIPKLQVYDRGERFDLDVIPATPGSDVGKLQVAVDGRGDGVVIRGANRNVTDFQSLRSLRTPRLTSSDVLDRNLDRPFTFTRNADALLQRFEGAGTGEVGFLPITDPRSGGTVLAVPDPSPEGRTWFRLSASDASVLYWIEQKPNPTRADGNVYAIGYPSEFPGGAPGLTEPTLLGQGELRGRGVDTVAFASRISDEWCPGRVCASPDGTTLTAMGPGPCTLRRWRWTDALSPFDSVAAESIVLPEDCPIDNDPHLWAQLADDLVALDDEDRVYLFDITAGSLVSVPKVGNLTGIAVSDRGRAFVMISGGGQTVRVDDTGVRIVNAASSPCVIPNPEWAASPLGHWVIQTCAGDAAFLPTDQGQVYRISGLGLESFSGIPMRPLGIDDEGNALLFSYDSGSSDGDPRGLFVLTGDGRLNRVDDLEPSPKPISSARLESIWFAAHSVALP